MDETTTALVLLAILGIAIAVTGELALRWAKRRDVHRSEPGE